MGPDFDYWWFGFSIGLWVGYCIGSLLVAWMSKPKKEG